MKEKITLESRMNIRSNNLQFLRFVAALLVLIGHSFVLCESDYQEIVYYLTGKEVTLGRIAVAIFLFASGLFIARSVENKHGFKEYFSARAMRIFPLLWVVVLLSMGMGALCTKHSFVTYVGNVGTWKYLLNGVFVLQHDLPGVFQGNSYGSVVNGALWTLPVEFVCYIVCFLCYHFGVMKRSIMKWTIPFCIIGSVLAVAINKILQISIIEDTLCLCIIFYIGMLYYVYRHCIVYNRKGVVVVSLILIVSIVLKISWIGILCAFPYYLSWFFFSKTQISERLACLGDYSYAMYLCAFPIQQLWIYVFGGNMDPYTNIVLSSVVTIVVAYLLVMCIERPLIEKKEKR